MFEREITDVEFLNSFQSFGFAARPALSFLLCEKLKNDPELKEHDEKAIILATIENYYFQTEIVLMLLETIHQKKENHEKAFVSIYNNVFIKEGQSGEYSETLLTRIREWDSEQLINYLGLKQPKNLLDNLDEARRVELEVIFGGIDQAIQQGLNEIDNLKKSLESSVSNRIFMNERTKIPFYKLLNKLKHGYQVVEDIEENVLTILIDLVEDKSDKALFRVIEIPIKKETAYFFADQTKYMAEAIRHLLRYYILSNAT